MQSAGGDTKDQSTALVPPARLVTSYAGEVKAGCAGGVARRPRFG